MRALHEEMEELQQENYEMRAEAGDFLGEVGERSLVKSFRFLEVFVLDDWRIAFEKVSRVLFFPSESFKGCFCSSVFRIFKAKIILFVVVWSLAAAILPGSTDVT